MFLIFPCATGLRTILSGAYQGILYLDVNRLSSDMAESIRLGTDCPTTFKGIFLHGSLSAVILLDC
jgi:hypothetical protein